MQEFIKKLRRKLQNRIYCIGWKPGQKGSKKHRDYTITPIRYLATGEYGEKNGRGHYHIIIFGYEFIDKEAYKISQNGNTLYRSKYLESIWEYGFSDLGEVNFKSISYVARYTTKKSTITDIKGGYDYDPRTGQIRTPEFIYMSRGIGKEWHNRYKSDTNKDYLLSSSGQKFPVPRYYDKLREKENPESLEAIKKARTEKARIHSEREGTESRLYSRGIIKQHQLNQLIRELDND